MVKMPHMRPTDSWHLSVLALSSRFDGHNRFDWCWNGVGLSVLALSSRFDGLGVAGPVLAAGLFFQYSLCRVVLMVMLTDLSIGTEMYTFSTRSVESF